MLQSNQITIKFGTAEAWRLNWALVKSFELATKLLILTDFLFQKNDKKPELEWKFIKSVSNKFIDIFLFCKEKFW